jgi:hemolysin activation/secretion protein
MQNTMRFLPKVLLVLSAQGLLPSLALAVVDAGALQQNLEKQLPPPRTLPEPGKAKPLVVPSKDSEVRFVVNAFALEGVSILPESQVQAVLKPF